MHKHGIVVLAAMTLWSGLAIGQPAPGGAPAAPPAPVGKAGYFTNSDLQNIWKDLEARQVLNKRVLEGGSHSINIRIVRPTDAPLVHANSLDIWLVTAGSATAVTGGQLVDMKKRRFAFVRALTLSSGAGATVLSGARSEAKAASKRIGQSCSISR